MESRWFHKAVLFEPGPGKARKVSWLELFYDLIYVATIIQLGSALSDHASLNGFLMFAGLFVPIWYTWTGFTFFNNRVLVDDFAHRLLVFGQMFAIGAMAVSLPNVLDGEYRVFALCYAAARIVLVLLYARAWLQITETRAMTRRFVLGFGLGAALWSISGFLPAPWVYIVWAVAMGVDLSVPLSQASRELNAKHPPDSEHMTERYGLLTIIVLGESFVKVLSAVTELVDQGLGGLHILLMGGLTVTVTCALWWIYFDDVAGSRIRKGNLSPYIWIYTHLPLTIAVTASGVAVKKAVLFNPLKEPYAPYAWLLCGTLALALVSVAIIDSVTERRHAELSDKARVRMRLASAGVLVLLAAISSTLDAWAFVALVSAICAIQVIFDISIAPMMTLGGEHKHEDHHKGPVNANNEEDIRAADPTKRRWGLSDSIRKGTPDELRRDLYFHLMEGSWLRLLVTFSLLYLLSNGVFAALYLLDAESLNNVRPGSFIDAFNFSVQTMATIGYGAMTPSSLYGHTLVTIEAAFGIFGVTLATGLMFAKASRPRSSVLFSNVATISTFNGADVLMIRLGNARGNEIVEANLRLTAVIETQSAEGQKMRLLHDLKLRRDTSPLFTLTWTVFHDLDDNSPLKGINADNAESRLFTIIATMTGYDATYAQNTHSRKLYYPEHLRFNEAFVDVLSTHPDGRIIIDYELFHATRPPLELERRWPGEDGGGQAHQPSR